jgi:hypothetical protein
MNKLGDHIAMIKHMRDNSVMISPQADLEKARAEGKYILGVLHQDTSRPELCELYEELGKQGGTR